MQNRRRRTHVFWAKWRTTRTFRSYVCRASRLRADNQTQSPQCHKIRASKSTHWAHNSESTPLRILQVDKTILLLLLLLSDIELRMGMVWVAQVLRQEPVALRCLTTVVFTPNLESRRRWRLFARLLSRFGFWFHLHLFLMTNTTINRPSHCIFHPLDSRMRSTLTWEPNKMSLVMRSLFCSLRFFYFARTMTMMSMLLMGI